MADDVPRHLPFTGDERARVLAEGQAGGSLRGSTRWGRRVSDESRVGQPTTVSGIAVVEHGDDPDVPRPLALVVWWVGAATPSNAVDYDDWYPANVTD